MEKQIKEILSPEKRIQEILSSLSEDFSISILKQINLLVKSAEQDARQNIINKYRNILLTLKSEDNPKLLIDGLLTKLEEETNGNNN